MEFFSKSGKAKMSSKISNVDLLLAHSNYPVITFLENPLLPHIQGIFFERAELRRKQVLYIHLKHTYLASPTSAQAKTD